MANNPYVNKVIYGNDTVMDISDTTATEGDVVSGKTFYKASGARSTGSAVIPDISNCYETTDTAGTTIDDADYFPFYDSSATAKRKSLWSNIKSVLKTYFDTLYQDKLTMISNSGYETTMATHALDSSDDDIASAYVIANWSNCSAKVILTTADKDDDGIGTWEADGTWESGSRVGWLWSADLYHVLDDGASPTPTRNYSVEVIPVFDMADSETISLYAYRIDDDVTNNGVHGGAVAFKFNGKVQNATGVKVGVKLVFQRTEVNDTGTILT